MKGFFKALLFDASFKKSVSLSMPFFEERHSKISMEQGP